MRARRPPFRPISPASARPPPCPPPPPRRSVRPLDGDAGAAHQDLLAAHLEDDVVAGRDAEGLHGVRAQRDAAAVVDEPDLRLRLAGGLLLGHAPPRGFSQMAL